MNFNMEKTTVRDISRLINTACLTADASTSLERLAEMLCSSDRYKIYLNDGDACLCGIVQAKQIAMKVLEFSRKDSEKKDMLPTIAFALNSVNGSELAEPAVTVNGETPLVTVLELMDQNHIREIAVVDDGGRLIGTLEAKNILSTYLREKAEAYL